MVILWVVLIGVLLGDTTSALKCFSCEGEECAQGSGWIVECPKVSSVCIYYQDVTGRALKKGPGKVYRRQCGGGSRLVETACHKSTANFDMCVCKGDLCNGDPNAPPPPTSTPIPNVATNQQNNTAAITPNTNSLATPNTNSTATSPTNSTATPPTNSTASI